MKRLPFVFSGQARKALLLILLFFPFAFAESQTSASLSKKLLILGDSLTEGYGVARDSAYPALVEKELRKAKKDWTVIGSGFSGSTSASAVSRLKWQLKSKPDLLVLALGANDGLRGLSVDELEKNLSSAVEVAKKENVPVVLAGMMMPPNYSRDYSEKFKAVFPRVAKKHGLKFYPFLLDGVAGRAELNLSDGIHPNEKGHRIIAEKLSAFLIREVL